VRRHTFGPADWLHPRIRHSYQRLLRKESGRAAAESALRFSMNLMGLWAIVAGLGIGWLARWAHNHHFLRSRLWLQRYVLLAIGALLLLASGFATFYLRRDAIVDDPMLDALVASDAKLIFPKQHDRFLEGDLERYGEPIRRVLAMPSERLDGGDGFSVSLIEH
jgi:hypothetical protein